jgi:hypothetical protein
MQLLEIENKELCECITQQTLERLQEYEIDSFETIEGIRGVRNGHWECISSQE